MKNMKTFFFPRLKLVIVSVSMILFMLQKEECLSQKTEKEVAVDPFRLDYKNVYENIHYNQPLRPQVHYTPLTGQIADPTGLILYKGKYHLFYMYDEWSRKRGDNKNWGHATSNDCIFWTQEPQVTNTIIDNAPGSGSGMVDWNNTLKLQAGVEKTLVIFYTDYGRGPSLAFSRDAGKTWIRHKDNPVLPGKNDFRDPNVFWYKPDQSWRMVVYEEQGFSFYKSDDLLHWKFLSCLKGFFECPDLIQMPVDEIRENTKWVLIDGNGAYVIGQFDGNKFMAEGSKYFLAGGVAQAASKHPYTKDVYATQTWKQSYEGDGPFCQLAFMRIEDPPAHDRTWSQQMIFPVELTLKTIGGKIKLCRNPINAIKQLRFDPLILTDTVLQPDANLFRDVKADVFEMVLEMDLAEAKEIEFNIRGEKLVYDAIRKEISFLNSRTPVETNNRRIKFRLLVDRNSVELYVNSGEISITRFFYPQAANMNIGLFARGGYVALKGIELYRLQSIWLKREQELGYTR